VPNSRVGIFLGYSRTLKILYYYDVNSAIVKTATHARFDEGMNDLEGTAPPNVQILRQLDQDGNLSPDKFDLSPLDLSVSDNPFDRLDTLTLDLICDHPTLGFEIAECHIRKRAYITNILPDTTAARIKNARRKYIGSFVVSVNGNPVFTATSAIDALTTVGNSDATTLKIVLAPERYIPIADQRRNTPVHLSVDQIQVINRYSPHQRQMTQKQTRMTVLSSSYDP
jgi:hypothetical protein